MGSDRSLLAIAGAIGAIVIAAIVLVVVVGDRPPAAFPPGSSEATVQGYLAAWEDEDYAAAYAFFSAEAKARVPLEAFEQAGDERGCAIAYHNLGMIATQRGDLDDAAESLSRSATIAARIEDIHLEGLCQLNRADVAHRQGQYEEALRRAEAALGIFEQLGSRADKSDVYRVIGMVFRDTGRPVLAEARLRAAVSLALETSWVLGEAEASRELARLYQGLGRNQEALKLLNHAHGIFSRLDARVDLVDVAGKQQ